MKTVRVNAGRDAFHRVPLCAWFKFGTTWKSSLLPLIALLLVCATPALAIRNGTPESSPQYSGVGKVIGNTNLVPGTGALISRHCVLTAAQNVFDGFGPVSNVVFQLDAQHSATATAVRIPPEFWGFFGANVSFDVAVLLLDTNQTHAWDAFARSSVRTIPITSGSIGIGIGFGESSNGTGAGGKRSGILSINGYAGGSGPLGEPIPNGFLEVVAGDGLNQMFCTGDQGAPLYVEGQIAGIFSFRTTICNDPAPAYCVATERLAGWIADQVNELDPPAQALNWFTVDGGGVMRSTGGVFTVSATSGQPDAGRMSGGALSVEGGFWAIVAAVQTPGAPLLRVARTTTNTVLVAWPAPSPGFVLQQNSSLTTTNWTGVTNVPVTVGSEQQVIIAPPLGNRFYRLIK